MPHLPDTLRVDDQSRIGQDVSCTACGYNLRTISVEAKCPECGQPVTDSLAADRLYLANPAWLKRLTRGLSLVLIGTGIFIPIMFLSAILEFAYEGIVGLAGFLQLLMLNMSGHWLFTTPSPTATTPACSERLRKSARLGLIFGNLALVVALVAAMLGFDPLRGSGKYLMLGIPLILMSIVLFSYAQNLCLRIPDKRLAVTVRLFNWFCSGTLTLVSASQFINYAWYNNRITIPDPWFRTWILRPVNRIFPFAILIVIILGLILLVVYRRRLGKLAAPQERF